MNMIHESVKSITAEIADICVDCKCKEINETIHNLRNTFTSKDIDVLNPIFWDIDHIDKASHCFSVNAYHTYIGMLENEEYINTPYMKSIIRDMIELFRLEIVRRGLHFTIYSKIKWDSRFMRHRDGESTLMSQLKKSIEKRKLFFYEEEQLPVTNLNYNDVIFVTKINNSPSHYGVVLGKPKPISV